MRVDISSSDWQDLEEKMQENFTEGDNYEIQNVGGGKIMIKEDSNKPTLSKDGNIVSPEQWIGIIKQGKKFWIKAIEPNNSIINIQKKEV